MISRSEFCYDDDDWLLSHHSSSVALCSCKGNKTAKMKKENSWISEPEKKGGGLHMSPSSVSLG